MEFTEAVARSAKLGEAVTLPLEEFCHEADNLEASGAEQASEAQ
jgi:hypothetical protein